MAIGELTGFGKISSTMYNNTASKRLRDLRARFASGVPQGAVVDIEEDPFGRVNQEKSIEFSSDTEKNARWERARAAHKYFSSLLLPYEGPPGFEIPSPELEFIKALPRLNATVATTLAPLGGQVIARLMYHGYLQAMTTMHVEFGSPLMDPMPTMRDFLELTNAQPRSRRPCLVPISG